MLQNNLHVFVNRFIVPLPTPVTVQKWLVSWTGICFVAAGDMAENGDAACFYPQEILDLNWSTTSKERIQKAYKVWSVCYDKVLLWGVNKHSIIRNVCELRQVVITEDWPGVQNTILFHHQLYCGFRLVQLFSGTISTTIVYFRDFRPKKGRDIWKLYMVGRHPKEPQRWSKWDWVRSGS